jgi:hypothetical protein
MADAYVIEIDERAAGIVTREHDREAFTFYASDPAFYPLEGRHFAAPGAASRAALTVLRQAKSLPRGVRLAAPAPELNL